MSAWRSLTRRLFPPERQAELRVLTIKRITSRRKLNPARRPRSYPRVVKRARHNSYRVKRSGDAGGRHHGPAVIDLVNLPPDVLHVPAPRSPVLETTEAQLKT